MPTIEARPSPHQHIVSVYDRDDELVREVAEYVSAGLAGDETVVVVGTPAHQEAVDAALVAEGIDVATARVSGTYVTLDAADTLASFTVDGLVDGARFEQVIGGVLADAARLGRPVRAFGEMVALLWADGAPAEAIRLEGFWNDLAAVHDFTLLCAYPVGSFLDDTDLAAVAHVCRQHGDVLPPSSYATPASTGDVPGEHTSSAFLPVPTAVRAARRFVTETLDAWRHADLAADARLIVSELATNAVSHAGSPFRVTLRRWDRSVRIGVEDISATAPQRRQATLDDVGGRGMALVDGLSADWGTAPVSGGKVVWSDLAAR